MSDELLYKLARPLMKGVPIEILNGEPFVVSQEWSNYHKEFRPKRDEIQNRMIRDILQGLPQFKGELVVGKPVDPDCYEMTKLLVESTTIIAPFVLWVYDLRTTHPFDLRRRLDFAEKFVITCPPMIQYVDHTLIQSEKELEAYKKTVINENFFPGVVLREPHGTFGTEDETFVAPEAKADAS